MEGFKLFDNSALSRVVDKITITKNYSINFPSAFYKINNLYEKKSVLLFYNNKRNQMAFVFRNECDPRGFKITAPNNGQNGGYITAKNFFVLNGIVDKIEIGRYDYRREETEESVDKDPVYLLQLKYK